MIAIVAKLCDYDFEDYDLQKMKYNYLESGIESSNDRARQHPPWPRILSFLYIYISLRMEITEVT